VMGCVTSFVSPDADQPVDSASRRQVLARNPSIGPQGCSPKSQARRSPGPVCGRPSPGEGQSQLLMGRCPFGRIFRHPRNSVYASAR
jgi:hypothetical protein